MQRIDTASQWRMSSLYRLVIIGVLAMMNIQQITAAFALLSIFSGVISISAGAIAWKVSHATIEIANNSTRVYLHHNRMNSFADNNFLSQGFDAKEPFEFGNGNVVFPDGWDLEKAMKWREDHPQSYVTH